MCTCNLYLERHESCQRFQTEIATVNEISHEYVVCVGHLAAASKQLFQIVKLQTLKVRDNEGKLIKLRKKWVFCCWKRET